MSNSKPLWDSKGSKMRVAGFMSGSGTNLRTIIEFGKKYPSFEVVVIFSDTYNSNAPLIGREYNIPVVIRDIRSFYASKGKPIHDMETRAEFDEKTIEAISPYNVSVIAYAGYMSIASDRLVKRFTGINIHPADLSIMRGEKRKYTGANAVRDAIVAGEKYIASTCHLLDSAVDEGPIFMISAPIEVEREDDFDPHNKEMLARVVAKNQDRLKKKGDWVIFPLTLLYCAQGRYNRDEHNRLLFDGKIIPYGVRLEKNNAEIYV
ncbi:MAG: phosphoribosylglycinamide formyltransferase [bacterium]